MPLYVAFLRGINLGNRRIKMADLKTRFEEIGFEEVATFIASGNVVFKTRAQSAASLETKIETHLRRAFGYEVETFIRSAEEIREVLSFTPFRRTLQPGNTLCVAFLKEPLGIQAAKALEAVRTDADEFRAHGKEFFWFTQAGLSDSVVWDLPQAKALQLPSSTLRNINTVRKLAEKHGFGGA